MDDELAAWCRDRLRAEPEAVLFRAGSLSTVTAPELVRVADEVGERAARAGLEVAVGA